jgi:hypothetical protein
MKPKTKTHRLPKRDLRWHQSNVEAMTKLAQIALVLDIQKSLHPVRAICIGRLRAGKVGGKTRREILAVRSSFNEVDEEIDAGLINLAMEAFSPPKKARR